MPANFKNVLTIDEDGRVSPEGPLGLDPGESLIEVYAWVIQTNDKDGTGAFCGAEGNDQGVKHGPTSSSWTTEAGAEHRGRFRPGPARGTGVTITKKKDSDVALEFWWSESITLRLEQVAAA